MQPDTDPIAAHLNTTPTFVATRKLTSLDWEGAEGEGAITILGSGALVHELMQLHLVDGFRLFVHPLLDQVEPGCEQFGQFADSV